MTKEKKFLLMDGRAWLDIDKAYVFEVCGSLEEARENKGVYGASYRKATSNLLIISLDDNI
jgi:hypothetical protein